jgi:hypothetical protein
VWRKAAAEEERGRTCGGEEQLRKNRPHVWYGPHVRTVQVRTTRSYRSIQQAARVRKLAARVRKFWAGFRLHVCEFHTAQKHSPYRLTSAGRTGDL